MPSPFGRNRNAAQYYQHGGIPMHYQYNWDGMPQGSIGPQKSNRALGWTEVSEGADLLQDMGDDFIDVQAHFRKSLGSTDYPVAMSMQTAMRSVRHSGPEQTHLFDSWRPMGFFGTLSNNERILAFGVLGAAAVYVALKYMRKPARRNPGRRRRRR